MTHRFLGLDLSEGVKPRHFMAYLFVVLISSAYAGALAILQPGLLQVIGVPQEEQGQITGLLGALQEAIFLVMMVLYGLWADRFGRRRIYLLGLVLTSIGFTLYGSAENLTQLIGYRVIVAFGTAAMLTMMVTVVADYAQDNSRGRANGVQGLLATLGAFIPPILAGLPQQFVEQGYTQADAQQATFAVAGAMGIAAIIVAFFGLAKGVANRPVKADDTQPKESMATSFKHATAAAKNPKIALSYAAAFISRGDLAVTGAFVGLWLVQFGGNNMDMTPSQAMAELVMPSVMMVVGGALVGSLAMGWLSDRITRVQAVTAAAGLAGVIYSAMFFVTDPTQSWVKGLLFVMGVAEISAFVSSQALVGEQAPSHRRGAIIGFFGVAGAVGIFLGTAGGGTLFSKIGPSAPFVLFGILNFVVFFWGWRLSRKSPEPQPELKSALSD
ncbi:MFS transporter [Paraferrimonas sedimenticola]|uniref:MFS transporter n=1 Tax=Paraferrimonas sedimenticola TaxID=375674 RepID=A0AA37RW73_9GAMM|nr:MFS transporter [Paraferrimonas sedimenticola]GLP96336.1 MFS transporter [Paraferrimonas sedimenticola]